MSMSRTVPEDPKSIVAVAREPTPSTVVTVPRPYLSWLTRSPTSREVVGASFQSGRIGERREGRPPAAGPHRRGGGGTPADVGAGARPAPAAEARAPDRGGPLDAGLDAAPLPHV